MTDAPRYPIGPNGGEGTPANGVTPGARPEPGVYFGGTGAGGFENTTILPGAGRQDGNTAAAPGPGDENGPGDEKQKKSGGALAVIAAGIVAVLLIAALAWFLFLRPAKSDEPVDEPAATSAVAPTEESGATQPESGQAPTSNGPAVPSVQESPAPAPAPEADAPGGEAPAPAPAAPAPGQPAPGQPGDGPVGGRELGQELGGLTGHGNNNHAAPPIGQAPPQ